MTTKRQRSTETQAAGGADYRSDLWKMADAPRGSMDLLHRSCSTPCWGPIAPQAEGHRPRPRHAGRQDRAEPPDERDAGGRWRGRCSSCGSWTSSRCAPRWRAAGGGGSRFPASLPTSTTSSPTGWWTRSLGRCREGWEVKALGSFGKIITGKTPSTRNPDFYGTDVPFLRIPDMHGRMYALQTEVMLSAQGVESRSKKTLPSGSVSVSCIATPGLVVLNHRDTQTNQQINSIPYDQSVSRYLYWTCSHLSSDIATGGLGGSVLAI